MLAWFFGLSRMTQVVTYIAAILGMVYAAEQVWIGARTIAGW